MANTFIHGRLTTISIGGTQFAGLTASYAEKLSSLDDITYTVAGGATFAVFLPGYNMATGTITFVYDTSNSPVLSPQNMIPGTLMTLVVSPDGTKLYSFNAYSSDFTWTGGPTAGTLKASTNYQSTGTITRPAS
jgi:hypothetical protein